MVDPVRGTEPWLALEERAQGRLNLKDFRKIIQRNLGQQALIGQLDEPLQGFTLPQIAEMHPAIIRLYTEELARLGEKYPQTLLGLAGIEPATAQAHFMRTMRQSATEDFLRKILDKDRPWPLPPRQSGEWTLGINPSTTEQELVRQNIEGIQTKFHPGGSTFENLPIFMDPAATTPTHEFGHAMDQWMADWLDRFEHPAAAGVMDDFKRSIVSEALNAPPEGSYATSGAIRNLRQLKAGKSIPDLSAAQKLELSIIDNKFVKKGLPVSAERLQALEPRVLHELAREPIAEAFSLRETPWLPGTAPQSLNAVSRVQNRWGRELGQVEQALANEGWVGAATPEFLARGAAGMGVALAAPILINKFVKDTGIRNTLQGALQGAGLGGMFGPGGAAVGAGVGGLGALARQVFS